jgi:glutamyl-tRNA reductase
MLQKYWFTSYPNRRTYGADPVRKQTRVAVLGLNHKTAPVEIREKLYFPEHEIPHFTEALKNLGVQENVILSTCNRTEIYFSSEDHETALERIRQLIAEHIGLEVNWLNQYTYSLVDEVAYRHLFLVSSGLDSMVIGEPQILGQVKDAYRAATHQGSTGLLLDKVFHRTFSVAKRIRTETKIGYNPVSISSMAVELSKKIFGDLSFKKILVVGAGEMCEIALKHFKKEGLRDVLVTNRTYEKAQSLADETTGTAYPFEEIPALLNTVAMVLTSTGAEKPIITKDVVLTAMKRRKNKPLFFIDIAVPRDVDPSVNAIGNVYLYDIDDLRQLSQQHLSDRQKESEKAEAIVSEEVAKFSDWITQLDKTPLITQIYEKAETIRQQEIKKSVKKLHDIDDETLRQIDLMTRSIVNKLIHPHVSLIKKHDSPAVLEIMKTLFKFEGEDEEEMDHRDAGQ